MYLKGTGDKMETQTVQKEGVKVGDLFYTSWGYDQTNYDYVVVVEVSPTGKTAVCQLAEYEHLGFEYQCNIQKPKAKGYGYKFRLKVTGRYNGEVGLRGSYPFIACQVAELEKENSNEKPSMRFGYFSKVNEGRVFHETHPMFGH